jgi:hypothetical protein
MVYNCNYIRLILIILCTTHMNLYLTSSMGEDQVYGEYEPKPEAFSLIEDYDVKWVGHAGSARLVDNSTIPFARIIDPNKEVVSDLTEACAIGIDIAPKRDKVNIEGIIIEVDSYNPIPPNMSLESTLAFTPANVFYVEIDDPITSHKNHFEANSASIDGKIIDNVFTSGSFYLTKDNPEPVAIRINAKNPGIYTFSCMILARYENIKERIMITGDKDKPFKFAFIK